MEKILNYINNKKEIIEEQDDCNLSECGNYKKSFTKEIQYVKKSHLIKLLTPYVLIEDNFTIKIKNQTIKINSKKSWVLVKCDIEKEISHFQDLINVFKNYGFFYIMSYNDFDNIILKKYYPIETNLNFEITKQDFIEALDYFNIKIPKIDIPDIINNTSYFSLITDKNSALQEDYQIKLFLKNLKQ